MALGLLKPSYVFHRSGTDQIEQLEAVGQTWEESAFLSSVLGRVQETDGIAANNAAEAWVGLAKIPAQEHNYTHRIEPLTSDTTVKMQLWDSGAGALQATAQAYVGQPYGIVKVTSGGKDYFVVDLNDQVNVSCQVVGIDEGYDLGTVGGPVFVKILKDRLFYQP